MGIFRGNAVIAASAVQQMSVEGRKHLYIDLAKEFNSFLMTVPGNYLASDVRLAIAHCAQAALKFDDGLPRDACLRPGTDFATYCANTLYKEAKEGLSDFIKECHLSLDTAKILRDTIFAIASCGI